MPQPSTRRDFLARLAAGSAALLAGATTASCAPAESPPPPGRRKLGIALVGLGHYSTDLLAPALRETRLCRLAGIVSGSPAKAERWMRLYGIPKANVYDYATMDRIADNPDIDIIYVVTPHGLHAEHTIRAAKAGKHVICEKPMALNVADCDAMILACREAKVKLQIGYRLHYHAGHQELTRIARDRDLGLPLTMDGANGFRAGSKGWRMTQKLAGGGPLMDMGVYVVQAACCIAGAAPVAVTAKEDPKARPELFDECEETLRWTMEFAEGSSGTFMTSFNEGVGYFRATGPQGDVELSPAYSYRGVRGRTHRGALTIPNINQQAAQMDAFAANILDDTPVIVPGEMGRRDMQIITAIYEAARTGRRVEVSHTTI
ncbi:MAG: Gfo/Idh/MocA family oxidoreductase [Opitutaceae bacterium]|nr:Gfo/Idh/MocA family oxidoreductase [Opitutaceae bacterium]